MTTITVSNRIGSGERFPVSRTPQHEHLRFDPGRLLRREASSHLPNSFWPVLHRMPPRLPVGSMP